MQAYISLILQGLLLGLTLAIMMGPIFVAITQSSIERGGKAGMMVGLGVWVSDAIFIISSYFFIHQIAYLVEDGTFKYWMGLLGGFILILLGIVTMLKKIELTKTLPPLNLKSYFAFWTKGFLVNTVNPFTFIFWIGVISTYVIGKEISHSEALVFLTSVFIVIVISDIAKVLLAKYLRSKLTPGIINMVIKVAGFLLLISGIYLLRYTG